jgi:hypothetical protein
LKKHTVNVKNAKATQELINSVMGNARGSRENVVDDLLTILEEALRGGVGFSPRCQHSRSSRRPGDHASEIAIC